MGVTIETEVEDFKVNPFDSAFFLFIDHGDAKQEITRGPKAKAASVFEHVLGVEKPVAIGIFMLQRKLYGAAVVAERTVLVYNCSGSRSSRPAEKDAVIVAQ